MELGEDSIKLVEKLSDKIHENYSTKLFLVQFLMGNMSSALSTASYQALSTRETGIKVFLFIFYGFTEFCNIHDTNMARAIAHAICTCTYSSLFYPPKPSPPPPFHCALTVC
jgi:hypothetical protein